MNFSPEPYNSDLPLGGDDMTPGYSAVLTDTEEERPLLEDLDGQGSKRLGLVTVAVVGGVGVTLLGLQVLLNRLEARVSTNTQALPEDTPALPSSTAEDEALGRHKTTAALAEQQSQLQQLQQDGDAVDMVAVAPDVTTPEPVINPPPAPTFTPRQVMPPPPPVRVPAAVPIVQPPAQLPTISPRPIPSPAPVLSAPPKPVVAAPAVPPVQSALPSPEPEPVAVNTTPAAAPDRAPVYQTHRVMARLAETVVFGRELLDFGLTLPIRLEEPLPMMTGDTLPAGSECLADALQTGALAALDLEITVCYQDGRLHVLPPASTRVLATDMRPLVAETVVTEDPVAMEATDPIVDALEEVALTAAEQAATDVLGDGLLGEVAGTLLETVTETQAATPDTPVVTPPPQPVYQVPAGTPVVVLSKAPVQSERPVATLPPPVPIESPVSIPEEPAAPPAIRFAPENVDTRPPVPAPVPEQQPLPTLEQLLAPLQDTTDDDVPSGAGSEVTAPIEDNETTEFIEMEATSDALETP